LWFGPDAGSHDTSTLTTDLDDRYDLGNLVDIAGEVDSNETAQEIDQPVRAMPTLKPPKKVASWGSSIIDRLHRTSIRRRRVQTVLKTANRNDVKLVMQRRIPYFAAALLALCSIGWADDFAADDAVPPSPDSKPAATVSPLLTPAEKTWLDRPLTSVNATTKPTEGELPPSLAAQHLSDVGVLFDSFDDSRPWMIINEFEWDAPATRHLPLFFEEPNLERLGYGHRTSIDALGYESDPMVADAVQPFVSAVHFFGRVALVPYICGVQPPGEPVYTLGVDRPGSPVFYRKHNVPLSIQGALYQAGTVCGLLFVIP
jgi:hypothetical protein